MCCNVPLILSLCINMITCKNRCKTLRHPQDLHQSLSSIFIKPHHADFSFLLKTKHYLETYLGQATNNSITILQLMTCCYAIDKTSAVSPSVGSNWNQQNDVIWDNDIGLFSIICLWSICSQTPPLENLGQFKHFIILICNSGDLI